MMRRVLVLMTISIVGLTMAAPDEKHRPQGEAKGHLEAPRDRHLPTPPQSGASRAKAETLRILPALRPFPLLQGWHDRSMS